MWSALPRAEHIECTEDMNHRGVAAIEHYVRVADRRKIAGTVHQQQWDMQIGFEQAMDQSACEVTLSCVDQDAADKVTRHHDGSGAPAVVDGSDIVGLQAQRESRSGEQFTIRAVKQDGHLRSHGD
jgi:hypothetical protein